jgi:hypothetical protein
MRFLLHRIRLTTHPCLLDSISSGGYHPGNRQRVLIMRDLDPSRYGEADRREVDPPIAVESATWSARGQLDWWVRERQEWWARVRRQDGRQRWIRAVDLSSCRERVNVALRIARPRNHG